MALKSDPQMTVKLAVIVLSGIIMIGGSWMILRRSSALDANTLQAIGVILLIPSILILAITNAIENQILATLLGGIFGYIFAKSSDSRK